MRAPVGSPGLVTVRFPYRGRGGSLVRGEGRPTLGGAEGRTGGESWVEERGGTVWVCIAVEVLLGVDAHEFVSAYLGELGQQADGHLRASRPGAKIL
jgi:hypothetical protein